MKAFVLITIVRHYISTQSTELERSSTSGPSFFVCNVTVPVVLSNVGDLKHATF